MIEELRDYLIRHGWDEDSADDVHDVYYADGLAAFSGDTRKEIEAWMLEAGEI